MAVSKGVTAVTACLPPSTELAKAACIQHISLPGRAGSVEMQIRSASRESPAWSCLSSAAGGTLLLSAAVGRKTASESGPQQGRAVSWWCLTPTISLSTPL